MTLAACHGVLCAFMPSAPRAFQAILSPPSVDQCDKTPTSTAGRCCAAVQCRFADSTVRRVCMPSSSAHVMVIVVELGNSISQDGTTCEGCAVRLHAVEYVRSKQKEAGARTTPRSATASCTRLVFGWSCLMRRLEASSLCRAVWELGWGSTSCEWARFPFL